MRPRIPRKIAKRVWNPIFLWFVIPGFLFLSFLGHAFLYFSFTRYFDNSERENLVLAIILSVLSVSFITTSVLAHYYDNRRTRYSYFLACIWLGVGFYLSLSFALIWILALLAEPLGIYVPMYIFGIAGIGVSSAVSIYGFYNAMHTRITRITVAIPNLPPAWEGKKVVQISDIHIGHILRWSYLRKIVKKINHEHPEIVCITGDLFDGMDGRLEHLVDALNDIEAPHGILYVDGNHETYLWVERALAVLEDTKTEILYDEILTIDELDFIGINHPEPWEKRDIASVIRSLENFDPKKPSILLYHTPEQIEQIAKTGVNLELCGHTHRGQIWPIGYFTWLIFHGRDYGLYQKWDYTLYTSSGVGTWWPPMRVWSTSEIVVITLKRKDGIWPISL